jgi:2-dehydropantoate 2-reductase
MLLPLLNGMSHIKKLDTIFGSDRVMGGLANIVATITPNGDVQRITDRHILTIGHRGSTQKAITREFLGLCECSEFNVVYSENIEQSLWNKWTFLATLAALTTLFESNIGEILEATNGGEIIAGMYEEACAVADENEHPIPSEAKVQALKLLTEKGSVLTASMMRDLQQGFRTEHEHILGDLLEMGNSKMARPLLAAAYVNMLIRARQLQQA